MLVKKKILFVVASLLVIVSVFELIRFVRFEMDDENSSLTGMAKPHNLDCVYPWDYGKRVSELSIHKENGWKDWICTYNVVDGFNWKRKN